MSSTKIKLVFPRAKGLHGHHMSDCKVYYVNIIPQTGSIRRIIVISENLQLGKRPRGHTLYVWEDVIRDAFWKLADLTGGMGPDYIEVAEGYGLEFRICKGLISDYLLADLFSAAVDVYWLQRVCLQKGCIFFRVYTGGGGKYDLPAVVLFHSLKQVYSTGYIDIVISKGMGCAFTHCLESC